MYTVMDLSVETGYSKDQIIKSCHRNNIDKIGKMFVIMTEREKRSIIEEIESRQPGNPNFIKKN